jgi:3'-phosphoadenosine 5'-phosphosulfate sulfotransferase (PAPS reductase)/FAD synthetase
MPTGDLMVRWCSRSSRFRSPRLAINNDPAFKKGIKLLFLTGERRQESTGRSKYAEREPHRCNRNKRLVHAWRSVIDWDEADVWAIIGRHRIMPHPAYRLGFPRVSCMGCIFGGSDQWASVRQIAPAVRSPEWPGMRRSLARRSRKAARWFSRPTAARPTRRRPTRASWPWPWARTTPRRLARVPEGVAWTHPAGAFKKGGGPI